MPIGIEMNYELYLAPKKAFIFGFDNVLYPEKDYFLQVYYLFAEFMEYTEQLNAKSITEFMQLEYAQQGSINIFEKTALKFNISEKYQANFALLHENARLPLKLLLFQKVLSFLQAIVIERKDIYLLVKGNPITQLNKIKQMEWHGLEKYLKVYFSEELEPSPNGKSLSFIIEQHNLSEKEVLYIGNEAEEQEIATNDGVDFLPITKLL